MAAKKKPKARAKREPRPKQSFLPGAEPEYIRPIEDAAQTYYEAMRERVALSKDEDEAKDNLIDKMKEHAVERYETRDGLVVTITSASNVKVKPRKEPKPEANGDGHEDAE